MNTFYAHSYPSWGQQPPFSGAPPMPTGVNVSQQQWQQGQWQFNPAYAANQAQAQQVWAPAQNWFYYNNAAAVAAKSNPYAVQQSQQQQQQQQQVQQQQQQQQQQVSRNPYKRYPKPPSQEYLSYQLKENGLGLFDMVPREELYKDKEPPSGADQTPWVWHPKRFPGEEDEGIVTAYYKDEHGNRDQQYRGEILINESERPGSTVPRERERTRSGESDRPKDVPERDVFSTTADSALERAWEYEGERERSKEKKHKHKKDKSSKERHRSEDPSALSSSLSRVSSQREPPRHSTTPMSSASAYAEQQQQQAKSQVYSQPPSSTRVHFLPTGKSSGPTVTPTKPQEPPTTHHPQPTQPNPSSTSSREEAFSSHVDLRPTFSPRIVRTPDHYRSPSVVSNTSTPTRPSSSSRSTSVVSSDFDRMSIGSSATSVTPSPLHRHATAPASFRVDNQEPPALTGVTSFSEEPATLLSPLPLLQPPHRPLSRGHSAPQAGSSSHPSLATIPENTSTSKLKSRPSSRRSYSPAGSASPTDSDSNPSSPSRSSPNYHSTSSKPIKRSPLSNPLPTPPRESQIMMGGYETPNGVDLQKYINSTKVRKGFWSKRGYHLTKEGEIIEPPDGQKYPPELAHYPSDPIAFMDHKGRITRVDDDWNQRRPLSTKRYEEYIHHVSV